MNDERIMLMDKTVKLLELLQNEDTTDGEIKNAIENITKIFSPDYDRITVELKKSLGAAFATALAEPDPQLGADFTRKSLTLLRTAIRIARGPKYQIADVETLMNLIEREIKNCEHSEVLVLDKLWITKSKALDYISDRVFEGYGQFTSTGFYRPGGNT